MKKCIDLNAALLNKIGALLKCYDSLHNINLRIDDWYKKIETSKGFKKSKKKTWKNYSTLGIVGGEVDQLGDFCNHKKNDESANKFKKELVDVVVKLKEYMSKQEVSCFVSESEKNSIPNDNISKEIKEILNVQKLYILELEENYSKVEQAIQRWNSFICDKNFYQRQIHCGCRFSYDEDWIEYDLEIESKIKYLNQTKIVPSDIDSRLKVLDNSFK